MIDKWTWWAAVIGLAWVRCAVEVHAASPNVIVVMTDDQGYGEFSCHGNPIASTPNIDRLAAGSLRLTDFHVSPMCTPTRGQLMTGLDAFRNGAVNVSSGRTLLRPELATMADVFRAGGYRTGIFGKWHLGDNYPYRPEDRGFDEAVWFPSSHVSSAADYWENDYFADTYVHNGRREEYDGYCTDVFFEEAMQWIDATGAAADGGEAKPFFVYVPLNAAHGPWFVPEAYRGPVRAAMQEHEELVKDLKPARRELLERFLAMGANIDENMGRLEAFLAARGMVENTIVVFLTDNGSTMGPNYFNAGMRGGKTTLWEGGHRVPCFVRWPAGGLGEPREIDELAQVQDLLPTLAELAGVGGVPEDLDGESLAAVLRGERETLDERMLVINYSRMPVFKVTYTTGNPAIPMRDGAAVLWKNWRLLENRELYDVAADPHQDRDVAAEHPDVVERMRAHLIDWWEEVREPVMEPQRITIGSEAENPMMLSACDWLDVFVDQQRQVRQGVAKNGAWHLMVERPGRYVIELRRWPRESGLTLDEGIPPTEVTDGVYPAGRALPVAAGRIEIGGEAVSCEPAAEGAALRCEVELAAGPVELQSFLMDADGAEICGAYFAYVERVE